MTLVPLSEAVSDDIKASKLAEDIRLMLYKHLYHKRQKIVDTGMKYLDLSKDAAIDRADANIELDTIVFSGEEHPCIALQKFMPEQEELRDVMIIFKYQEYASAYSGSGKMVTIEKPIKGFKYFVFMDVWKTTISGLLSAINGTRGKKVLIHELQHVIDVKRFKTNRMSGDMKSKSNYQGNSPEQLQQYHNDPVELNAYFHNIAEPLLDRIRFYNKNEEAEPGLTAMIYTDSIPLNFIDYLNGLPKLMDKTENQHWDSLNKSNKQRLISRLMLLHKEYVKIWTDSAANG